MGESKGRSYIFENRRPINFQEELCAGEWACVDMIVETLDKIYGGSVCDGI